MCEACVRHASQTRQKFLQPLGALSATAPDLAVAASSAYGSHAYHMPITCLSHAYRMDVSPMANACSLYAMHVQTQRHAYRMPNECPTHAWGEKTVAAAELARSFASRSSSSASLPLGMHRGCIGQALGIRWADTRHVLGRS